MLVKCSVCGGIIRQFQASQHERICLEQIKEKNPRGKANSANSFNNLALQDQPVNLDPNERVRENIRYNGITQIPFYARETGRWGSSTLEDDYSDDFDADSSISLDKLFYGG